MQQSVSQGLLYRRGDGYFSDDRPNLYLLLNAYEILDLVTET